MPDGRSVVADPGVGVDPDATTIRVAADAATIREAARHRLGIADLMVVRVGAERFAIGLAAIEEVVDLPALRPLPHMPAGMRGVHELRGTLLGVYAGGGPLGVAGADPVVDPVVGLVARPSAAGRRVVIAVDDVEGVLALDFAELSDAPAGANAMVLGVATRGPVLVAVLDAEQWVAGCTSDRTMEAA